MNFALVIWVGTMFFVHELSFIEQWVSYTSSEHYQDREQLMSQSVHDSTALDVIREFVQYKWKRKTTEDAMKLTCRHWPELKVKCCIHISDVRMETNWRKSVKVVCILQRSKVMMMMYGIQRNRIIIMMCVMMMMMKKMPIDASAAAAADDDDDDNDDDDDVHVQRSKVPLCADSKLYYERYREYSLIDGELVSTADTDDSCIVEQQTSDADQLMFTDDSKSSAVCYVDVYVAV